MTDISDDDARELKRDERQKKRESKASVTGQLARAAKVATNVSGVGAKAMGARLFGMDLDTTEHAAEITAALGGLKGPLMKIAQVAATIPDAVPEDYALKLAELQSDAPPMGWSFVKRRMRVELGADWQSRYETFGHDAAAAASLGQVHKATLHDGRQVAVKLQYPDMLSAVESDLKQLNLILKIGRQVEKSVDTRDIYAEIADRLREELDYEREARQMALYGLIFKDDPLVMVPEPVMDLTTTRLLTMEWLEGRKLLEFREHPLDERNQIAKAMFHAWWDPLARYGVIHGDPHLGNYAVRDDLSINLLDFGCVRIFRARFVTGVVRLYKALQAGSDEQAREAYKLWGFTELSDGMLDIMNFWARFIFAPMLDDRVRTIADGLSPAEYGRKEANRMRSELRKHGTIKLPKEFVFMDRAAIGLGAVFLHLGAELNWHTLFNEAIDAYDETVVSTKQAEALAAVGLDHPDD